MAVSARTTLAVGWTLAIAIAVGVRGWNALTGPLLWGYDAWGHVAYVLFLDLYRGVPWADQGWSYFHPPLHYALGWLLAQARSGEFLARGLLVLSSLASLGTAALAARVIWRLTPQRPWLVLLGFAAVSQLPVHLVVSAMPTNELTVCFLSAAAIVVFIANERRDEPTLLGDACVGALVGLTLLAKFSGLIPLAAVLMALAVRSVFHPRPEFSRVLARGAAVVLVAVAVCAPYYARNFQAFGMPFQMSRTFLLVNDLEAGQPPGVRGWRDYLSVSPRLFVDPDPLAPHLLRSIWGSMYISIWADTLRESDAALTPEQKSRERRPMAWMVRLGVVPTLLTFLGVGLAVRDVLRGRRRDTYLVLLLLTGAALGAFGLFAWRVPSWPAVRSSYLLTLSVPYAVFLARSMEFLGTREARWQRVAAPVAVVVVVLASSVVETIGVVLPRRHDAPATGALHYYFGEYEAARRIYAPLVAGAPYAVPWLENLAAVELAEGRTAQARALSQRAVTLARQHKQGDPRRVGRLAVAMAVGGDTAAARAALDEALKDQSIAELLANRGAIAGALGDTASAEADLNAALELAPEMTPAWQNLAVVLARAGRAPEAQRARKSARHSACTSPAGYPYGLGTGEILEWGVGRRTLLLIDGGELVPALATYYRGACEAMRRASEQTTWLRLRPAARRNIASRVPLGSGSTGEHAVSSRRGVVSNAG